MDKYDNTDIIRVMDDLSRVVLPETVKEFFKLHIKKKWLKIFLKELRKYNKLRYKANKQGYVLKEITERCNDMYITTKLKRICRIMFE